MPQCRHKALLSLRKAGPVTRATDWIRARNWRSWRWRNVSGALFLPMSHVDGPCCNPCWLFPPYTCIESGLTEKTCGIHGRTDVNEARMCDSTTTKSLRDVTYYVCICVNGFSVERLTDFKSNQMSRRLCIKKLKASTIAEFRLTLAFPHRKLYTSRRLLLSSAYAVSCQTDICLAPCRGFENSWNHPKLRPSSMAYSGAHIVSFIRITQSFGTVCSRKW